MRADQIVNELEKTLIRYRSGLISLEQSRQELSLLAVMLKAYDTVLLDERLDRLEERLETRR